MNEGVKDNIVRDYLEQCYDAQTNVAVAHFTAFVTIYEDNPSLPVSCAAVFHLALYMVFYMTSIACVILSGS